MEQEEDRLSSLPKIILYDILSRLPEKDATRTSVLSQTWLDIWNTFPILSFGVTQIIGMPPQPTENILKFCDYVKRRMLLFRDQSLAIKKFKLDLYVDFRHMSKDVDIWLKLACESGVEVIEFSVFLWKVDQEPYYALPMCVIEAKSLTKLVLTGSIKIEETFMKHSIKFSSLRELSMTYVHLGDEQMIEHLISFCPSIEYIHLFHCYVLRPFQPIKALSVSGLQKLKAVDVSGVHDISIDCQSLEKLVYRSKGYVPLKIDFDRCINLKELYLRYVKSLFLKHKWFLDLFSKFPFLESLKLECCRLPAKIDISSFRLKVLELLACYLKEVNIDAPNLLSCKCEYSDIHASKFIERGISFLRNSSQLEVKLMITLNFLDLCYLKEFVQNIKPHGVLTSLSLSIHGGAIRNPIELQVTSPPPSIKNLDLHSVPDNESLFSSLVNIILSSCLPSTISFSLECNRAFIELFYETLMRRKNEDFFCSSSDTKCWWHDLKDVKVIKSMKIDDNVNLKTMLDSLPTFVDEGYISLILEF